MRCDLLRCYYANNNSATAALRQYKREKNLHNDPCNPTTLTRMVEKFETTFTLHDAPRSGRLSLQESRLEYVSKCLQKTKNEIGSTSISKVSQDTGIPPTSVRRILHQQFHLYPYKLALLQELQPQDKIQRMEFSTWLLENPEMNPHILWTDEAYISLSGEINRHNCRIWSEVKPDYVLTTSLHPQKICVWFGFTSTFSVTPFFFETNVTANSYLKMLQDNVRPQLARKHKLSSTIFMQDGAPPHYAKVVRDYLYGTFSPNRVISRGCNFIWPARSPDLNPLDYWFWSTLKARVFHTNQPNNLHTLKGRITEECSRFTPDEFAVAVSNLPKRLQCVIDVQGGHIEHHL